MKNLAKLIVLSVFGLFALVLVLSSIDSSGFDSVALAHVAPKPTPTPMPANAAAKANAVAPSNTAANTDAAKPPAAPAGDKKMTKSFALGKDSFSEYGEVAFDHDTHAFKNYSPDGKTVVGCVE
ncbi:MAG: hypothetical protein ABIV48_10330, partial [Pyrinomonadaceae bacterium]